MATTLGDMESFNVTFSASCDYNNRYPGSESTAAFQSCVNKIGQYNSWFVTHGTPELNQNFYTGLYDYYMMLWSGFGDGIPVFRDAIDEGTVYGEGVALFCPVFKKGDEYELSFEIM